MHTSNNNTLFAWIGGVAGICLVALLLLSSASATLAWMSGGMGAGPCPATTPATGGTGTPISTHLPATTPTTLSSPVASPTAGGGGGQASCFPASGYGAAVVQWAKAMADALYVNPNCGG